MTKWFKHGRLPQRSRIRICFVIRHLDFGIPLSPIPLSPPGTRIVIRALDFAPLLSLASRRQLRPDLNQPVTKDCAYAVTRSQMPSRTGFCSRQ